MLVRIVTGLVLAPLAISAILWAPKYVMLAVLVVAAGRCADELVRMFPQIRPRDRFLVAVQAAVIALSPVFGWQAFAVVLALATAFWLGACLVEPDDLETAAVRAALGALGMVYVGSLVAMLTATFVVDTQPPPSDFDAGRSGLLGVLAMVFFGDTGAFFAGKALGRHKLYPLISPKKTVEGGIGGLLASMAAGWLFVVFFRPDASVAQGLALGAACGAFGQVGDFAESLFKRATNTKDSGQLLPGHGGLLDRVDGVLFAAPILYIWLALSPS